MRTKRGCVRFQCIGVRVEYTHNSSGQRWQRLREFLATSTRCFEFRVYITTPATNYWECVLNSWGQGETEHVKLFFVAQSLTNWRRFYCEFTSVQPARRLNKDRVVHIIRIRATVPSGKAADSFTPLSKSPPYWAALSPAPVFETVLQRGLWHHQDWAHEKIHYQLLTPIQSKQKHWYSFWHCVTSPVAILTIYMCNPYLVYLPETVSVLLIINNSVIRRLREFLWNNHCECPKDRFTTESLLAEIYRRIV